MIILASNSPRRKELLSKYIKNFQIIPSSKNEEINFYASPIDNAKQIAKSKGDDIFKSHPKDIIISADTIVIFNNQIFGKPLNQNEAITTLHDLNNKTHQVITAYYLKSKEKEILKAIISHVTFKNATEEDIKRYIELDKPFDKAGSYGIQDPHSDLLIKSYQGSINNIIGLPIEELLEDLKLFTY